MAADGVGGGGLTDAFGGRAQLAGERVLHRRLQAREPVVAQLPCQPYHGGGTRGRRIGEVGDGAERDELGVLEDDLGHPPFSGRQRRVGPADAFCDFHGVSPYLLPGL